MPYDPHKNFAYSTVATPPAPASSGLSLVVAAGEGARFPAPSFNAVVWAAGANPLPTNAEVVRVTAGPPGSDTFTIARAQEGSSARAIVAGDQIANAITAKALTDLESGGFGTPLTVFDSTLGADTASIDTGAGAIPGGFAVLEIFLLVRTSAAAVGSSVDVTVNNDTSLLYDNQVLVATNAAVTAGASVATAAWSLAAHGSGGSATYASALTLTFPGYAGSDFFKTGVHLLSDPDATAANATERQSGLGYRSISAITRVKVAGGGGSNLKAGSRMICVVR